MKTMRLPIRAAFIAVLMTCCQFTWASGFPDRTGAAWSKIMEVALASEVLDVFDTPPSEIRIEIKGRENIREFMGQFKFAAKPAGEIAETTDGEKIEIDYYCQCLGDLCFWFRDKTGKSTLRIEFCHREHLWVTEPKIDETQFWLEPSSAAAFAERMKGVFPNLRKRWTDQQRAERPTPQKSSAEVAPKPATEKTEP